MDGSWNLSMSRADVSVLSAKQNPISSANCAPDDHQESGWTSYFEDFSNSSNLEHSLCYSFAGSSLVSDAASCAAWKFSHHNNSINHQYHASCASPKVDVPKKLVRFKKTRAEEISKDDSLEDTASSPVNSPKVGACNSSDMISRNFHDHYTNKSMVNGFTSEKYSEVHIADDDDDKNELVNFKGKNIGCTDLKKRGLCLVPLSMLVNYL